MNRRNRIKKSNFCYICKEKFERKYVKKNIVKLEIITIIKGNIEVLHIVYLI